ncbi:MAG: hypothetical protein IPM57_09220 [Oligoflexia bacterium]|nr:hypothetical protein [Oligoflexia bacterium]
MRKIIKTGLFVSMAFILACETAEDNSLEVARKCIDEAARLVVTSTTAAKAQAAICEARVSSMTSKESGKIGFAAVLILEDKFTLMSNIASSMSSGSNKLANAMEQLVFTGDVANTNYLKMVNTYGPRSQSSGIQKITDLAKIANVTRSISAGSTAAQLETGIAGLTPANASTPGTSEYQIVQAAISMQASSCAGAGATSATCSVLTQAIGSSADPVAIMTAIQTYAAGSN